MNQPSATIDLVRRHLRTALSAALVLGVCLGLPPTEPGQAWGVRPASAQDTSSETRKERKQRNKEEKQRRKEEKRRLKEEAKVTEDELATRRKRYQGRTVSGLLDEARQFVDQEKWIKAREILLFLEDNPQAREVQGDVKFLLAETYYGEGGTLNWVEALSRYRTFMTFHPSHPRVDQAQYRLGMCYLQQSPKADRDQSSTENALFEFQKMLELHPNSPWADEAQERIREARDLLADHEFSVGEFYYKWEHYEAAAGRFEKILAEFPDYSRRQEVYRLLAQAHYKLGSRIEGDIYADKYRELGGEKGFNLPKEGQARKAGGSEGEASARSGAEGRGQEKAARKADRERRKAEEKAEKRRRKAEKKADKERRRREKRQEKEDAEEGETP